MKGPLFIYHGSCFDGFTAAWVYWNINTRAEFWPAKYGAPPPDVHGRDVVIADFSYPRGTMLQIASDARTLTVLDHHHTAQEALAGLDHECGQLGVAIPTVVFDMDRSGAGITWDYFCPREERPELVNYVEDRDLWRFKLPDSEAVAALVAATPMTFEEWSDLDDTDVHDMAAQGRAILKYIHQYGTKAIAEAALFEWRLEGAPAIWCMNLPYMNCSEHVTRLLNEKGGVFAAGYFRRADGRWQFSLRSGPDFDCSAVAKLWGGGGHKQAAGFDVADLSEVFA